MLAAGAAVLSQSAGGDRANPGSAGAKPPVTSGPASSPATGPGAAVARPLTAAEAASFERGKILFATTCAACHEADGHGAPGKAPSMRGSPLLVGHEGRPVRIILHGLRGRVTIDGEAADLEMPTLAVLTDDEIADALTYARREWGHRADPVSAATVARIRAETKGRGEPWVRQEVEALRLAGEPKPPAAPDKPRPGGRRGE